MNVFYIFANRRKLSLSYRKYTKEKVEEYIESFGCTLVSDYVGYNESIQIKCKCGRIFNTTFPRFKKGKTKCDVCSGKKYDYDYVKDFIESNDCILLSDSYNNESGILDIQCSCGNIFKTTFGKFKHRNKRKCNLCSIGRKNNGFLEIDEVTKFLSSHNIELVSEYKSSSEPLLVKCRCGEIYRTTFNKIKSAGRVVCPKCSNGMSKIEVIVKDYLDKLRISYKTQFTFSDLKARHNVYYRFDFAILKEDIVVCLIELDGRQHFEPIDEWGGKEYLDKIKYNDSIKNSYCERNDIKLFRIPYYNFNNIYSEIDKVLKYVNPVLLN